MVEKDTDNYIINISVLLKPRTLKRFIEGNYEGFNFNRTVSTRSKFSESFRAEK